MPSRCIELTPSHVLAALLWSATLKVLTISFLVDDHARANSLGNLAIVLMGAAATLTVYGFFRRWEALMRNAFELGRDSAEPPDLRSVN